ncbi:vam6/Vps39-like protein, partial [Trifolium medium]|nr:vam6/Vps39-like protein [Trifolium medium]
HSAYDSFELLTNSPSKIESIESYASKILLGCSDGSLLVYAPASERSATAPEEMRNETYTLERNLKGFARRPVVSMQVVESRELLLSLSESIAFHKLSTFETIAVITKAKGANAFCWDEQRGFLCFARQKRVCIFRHD